MITYSRAFAADRAALKPRYKGFLDPYNLALAPWLS